MEEKFSEVIELFKEATEKECYKIDLVDEEPAILDDKLGGKPYLPMGEEYPKDKDGNNLALLLQINLKNIELSGYPQEGILEIFTDPDVDYPCRYAVRYFNEGPEYQTELSDVDMSHYVVDKARKINLSKTVCYMPMSDYRFTETFLPIVNQIFGTTLKNNRELNNYFGDFAWYGKLREACGNPAIILGGYADFTQSDPRYDMKENRDECLFKLDSCGSYDKISLGDSGILFALISQEDIENKEFENAIIDWDCC